MMNISLKYDFKVGADSFLKLTLQQFFPSKLLYLIP